MARPVSPWSCGGDISFADKVNNAQSFTSVDYRTGERKGVLGVLVYDSDPDATELINMSVETTAPDLRFHLRTGRRGDGRGAAQ